MSGEKVAEILSDQAEKVETERKLAVILSSLTGKESDGESPFPNSGAKKVEFSQSVSLSVVESIKGQGPVGKDTVLIQTHLNSQTDKERMGSKGERRISSFADYKLWSKWDPKQFQ